MAALTYINYTIHHMMGIKLKHSKVLK